MLKNLNTYINKQNLFTLSDNLLVAVSGGIDSVCLATLLHKAGYKIAIAHCNFGLRGSESDADEAFVKQLTENLNVNFYVTHFNTSQYAETNKLSIQMAARELRYNWFNQLCKKHGFNYVAIAHNADDAIETFFINLIRGTGLHGLLGIKPKNQLIVRPLLFAHRQNISQWCSINNISFREDSSNKNDYYLRNKLRLNILPLFDAISEVFRQTMYNNLIHLNNAETIYQLYVHEFEKNNIIKNEHSTQVVIKNLVEHTLGATLLYEILKTYNFSAATAQQIFDTLLHEAGKTFYSNTHRVIKDRDYLIVIENAEQPTNEKYYLDLDTDLNQLPVNIKIDFYNANDYSIKHNSNIAAFDADKIEFPLIIRKWNKGDYFIPLGMQGIKKVSDFFIDQKLNLKQKEDTWLLTSGEHIVWIMGYRIDNRFKITPSTSKVFEIALL